MKKITVLSVLFLAAFISQSFAAPEVKWYTLKEGIEKARAEKKPMIVDFFFGKGCPRCEFLESRVYRDPSIAARIAADFIPVRIDLTRPLSGEEEQLGKRYDYKNDCLLLFLDSSGELIQQPGRQRLCFIDKVEPGEFMRYLDGISGKQRSN